MCFGTSDEHDTNEEPAYVLVQKIMKFPNRLPTITAEGCRMTGSLSNGIQRPDRTAMTLTVRPFEFMPLSCILDIWEARENICRTFVSRRILQVVGIRNVDDRTRNQLRIVPTHGDHGHIVHVLSSLVAREKPDLGGGTTIWTKNFGRSTHSLSDWVRVVRYFVTKGHAVDNI